MLVMGRHEWRPYIDAVFVGCAFMRTLKKAK